MKVIVAHLRFDYGRTKHSTSVEENGAMFRTGDSTVTHSTRVPLEKDGDGVSADFVLEEGFSQTFSSSQVETRPVSLPARSEEEAENMLQRHGEVLAELALQLHLPRPLARAGLPVGIGLETSDL